MKNKINPNHKSASSGLVARLAEGHGNYLVPFRSKLILNLALGPDLINEIAKSWGMSWNMGKTALENRMSSILKNDFMVTGSLGHLSCLVHGMEHECRKIFQYQVCVCR
jgi:hypothetical protein